MRGVLFPSLPLTLTLTLTLAGSARASECPPGSVKLASSCGAYFTAFGCCSGTLNAWCQDGVICQTSCASNPKCGWNESQNRFTCSTSGGGSPAHAMACPTCIPNCEGKECGPDGCAPPYAGTCGTCPPGKACSPDGRCDCNPDCAKKGCGDDGCGGSCGECALGFVCNPFGLCDCEPKCVGKACGDDGCGGSCGECPANWLCNAQFQCEPGPCVPDCGQKKCGPDGCGGLCGSCDDGEECQPDGSCKTAACVIHCEGRKCGPDGCGGSCGVCMPPSVCGADFQCHDPAACRKDCEGKQCGLNSCGEPCGACTGGKICQAGACVDPLPDPPELDAPDATGDAALAESSADDGLDVPAFSDVKIVLDSGSCPDGTKWSYGVCKATDFPDPGAGGGGGRGCLAGSKGTSIAAMGLFLSFCLTFGFRFRKLPPFIDTGLRQRGSEIPRLQIGWRFAMCPRFLTIVLLPLFAVFSFGLACGGGGSSTKKAATKTIKGKLTGLKGPTTVGAKTQDGKALKAVVDPKTKEFAINLPKGKSAVMSVKSGNETKKVKFARDKNGGAKQDNFSFDIPDGPFAKDADIGTVDFGETGNDIVIGDETDETSVWDFVDSDDDGMMDFDDLDDDGDGSEDFGDTDWASEDDWIDTAMDDEGDWDFFEADDMCDMSGTAECIPEDDEFFSADECDTAEGAEFCYEESEDGYYTDDDSSWMPDDIDTPDDTNPPDDSACLTACDKQCGDDEECLSDCVAKCY